VCGFPSIKGLGTIGGSQEIVTRSPPLSNMIVPIVVEIKKTPPSKLVAIKPTTSLLGRVSLKSKFPVRSLNIFVDASNLTEDRRETNHEAIVRRVKESFGRGLLGTEESSFADMSDGHVRRIGRSVQQFYWKCSSDFIFYFYYYYLFTCIANASIVSGYLPK
jgi:hypothetical protein